VLEDVPPNVTVAGVPAKIVSRQHNHIPSHEMDQSID